MGSSIKNGDAASPSPPGSSSAGAPQAVEKAPKPFKLLPEKFTGFVQLLFCSDPTWKDLTLLCVGLVSSAAAGVPFPIMGILFGELVDDLNSATCSSETGGGEDGAAYQHAVNEKVLQLVYIAIASFVLIYIYIVCWNLAGQRLAQRIRERYFRSLLRQDAAFFDKLQGGEVSSRLNGDIQLIQTGASEKVGIFIACTSFFITAYVIAFIKNARLAGMLVSIVPAFLLMSLVGGHYVQKYSVAMMNHIASASSIASEGLSHVMVVQAFSANARLEAKFAGYLQSARTAGIKKAIAAAIQGGLLYFIAYSANALAYWQGSRTIARAVAGNDQGTTVGQTYTVIFILVDASIIVSQIAPLLTIFGSASAAYQRLQQDIEHRSAIDATTDEGETLPSEVAGDIELRDVSFAYPSRPDRQVLNNVSIHCPAGKYTAIVGLSGSGKSTIAGLVTRLYDPLSGTVLLDGHDLKTLNVRNLRSYISLVQQEPTLLDRSILENIALGLVNSPAPAHATYKSVLLGPQLSLVAAAVRDGKDLDQAASEQGSAVVEIVELVRHAASLADARTFIDRLHNGFGTMVGSSGSLISGGQKQRIALARALIRDPRVLVLDEATAALDSISEQRIQTAIEGIAGGRTLISIAHRLSTIKKADNIIVMRTGEIVEQGTHAELIARGGAYADLVNLQNINAGSEEGTASSRTSFNESVDAISIEKAEATAAVTEEKKGTTSESGAGKDDKKAIISDNPEDAGLDSGKSSWKIFGSFGWMIRPYLIFVLIAFIAATAVGVAYSGCGLIFGNTLKALTPCHTPEYITSRGKFFALMFFVLALGEFFANFASWATFGFISEKLMYKVRVLSFRALFEQDLQWHQSANRNPSMLLAFITKDGNALSGFSGSIMGTMFSVVINLLAAVIMSHIIAWKIAIVCLVTVPILLGSGLMQLRALSQYEERHAAAFAESVGITVEAVNSIKTVATLSLEHEILGVYRRSLKGPRKEMAAASAYANLWLAIANSIGNMVYAFAYWWGAKQIISGKYDQSQFFIVLMAMLVSAQLWGQMFTLAPDISRARAAASRILSLIDLGSDKRLTPSSAPPVLDVEGKKDPEAVLEKSSPPSPAGGMSVAFRNVNFAYPARPDVQVLKDMSFNIQPGQFCALVGPSGAGKSTVMGLVERMYAPASGSVLIDGSDIAQREGVSFRDDIAYVPQDNVLFDGSIRFNVALGARPDYEPSDEEIHTACRLANIHETIMAMPDGYETQCGPNGSQLSGGQRQRLAIARALVRKPRLLLLDESTSALDAESERALQEGLEVAAKGITVIAIAHRLRTIRKADVIFLVEGGRVVDKGRHEELVERSETYRVSALHQMLGE